MFVRPSNSAGRKKIAALVEVFAAEEDQRRVAAGAAGFVIGRLNGLLIRHLSSIARRAAAVDALAVG